MLKAERSHLSADVAAELRDALRRRQKELPARWLAALDAATLRAGTGGPRCHGHESIEGELGLAVLGTTLSHARPRGLVCVRPSASSASLILADALWQRGSVTAIAAAELDSALAVQMLERITGRGSFESSAAVACDYTVDLPLPDNFPRPRVYLCLGNVLGSVTAVGAVRLLRVLRATMRPTDTIILGLEMNQADSVAALSNEDLDAASARHIAALGLINTAVGAAFDLSRFDYRPTYDPEQRRLETHLVARKPLDVDLPGVCAVRFRKGESIRTSVSCVFDRNRVAAMMAGVGLSLAEWMLDATGGYVIAVAIPAI